MSRQAFGDFLNGNPSSGRGGRGNGMGGRGGRGGGGGGRGRGGKSKQDYSDVPPIDYSAINRQTYKQMDGFAPSSYAANGPNTNPGTPSFRGKNKSRSSPFTPGQSSDTRPGNETPSGGSGAATPHFGLGFGFNGGGGRGRGAWNPIASVMRGRGNGRMKGRMADLEAADLRNMMAPVFVKAGTLFTEKELEGDPIEASKPVRVDDGDMVVDDTVPGDHDSAVEFQIIEQPTLAHSTESVSSETVASTSEQPIIDLTHEETAVVVTAAETSGTDLMLSRTMDEVRIDDNVIGIEEETLVVEMAEALADDELVAVEEPFADEEPLAGEESRMEEEPEEALFFVDDAPAASRSAEATSQILFNTSKGGPLIGEKESSEDEEEEEIIFVARKFAKPEPISLPSDQVSSKPTRHPATSGKSSGPGYMSVASGSRPVATKSETSKMHGKTKSKQKKLDRKSRREGRIRKTEGLPRVGDSDIDWGSDGPPGHHQEIQEILSGSEEEDAPVLAGLGSRIRRDEQAIMQDYVQNAFGSGNQGGSGVQGDEEIDMDALARFANGVQHPQHITLDDIADQKMHQQEDEDEGWVDSSGSELSDDDEDQGETSGVRPNMVEIAPGLFAQVIPDDGSDEEDALSEDAASLELEEILDDTSDDEMTGDALDAEDILKSGNRKQRNKVFKSIHNGDFGDDWDLSPAPKGKKAKMQGVPAGLQSQWEKDRQKKADKKKQRELDRLEAAMSLYPASKKGKGKGKKGKPRFGFDDVDSEDDDMNPGRKRGIQPVTDLGSLNQEIRKFIRDSGKTTMTLPPMEKFSRKRVHELASCYSLKSQSKGKGRGRFPILIKTSFSSVEVNEHKINQIVGINTPGKFFKAKYGSNSGKGPSLPGNASRSGAAVRHNEGDAVGHGASAIGSENMGHRLLSKMGWSQGDRIGLSGGLEAPIVAFVKTTKLGLGA
ncbi:hypothetical protein QFC21_002949 [Naganishia friedmannii]|uniref:Uncharacterized protein n=1 Tax=Naganishia friedmannii TaxID=89922 RepID=A0ACC2VT33_9TREE|nr:hypothetical protein QFC21_002949 [Naganishia friedmannii]